MADSSSPLSYQTTMPEYPDVSYQRWASMYGGTGFGHHTRLGQALNAWWNNHPNYQTWRTNQLDSYNASLEAYNAYASSPEGNRAQREAAGYNVNYDPGTVSSASPLSYQDVNPGNGSTEIGEGLSGLLSLVSGIQGMKMMSQQIVGKATENAIAEEKLKGQQITNKWLDRMLGYKAFGLGYNADWRRMQNEAEVFSRLAGTNLGKSDYVMDSFGPGLSLMYDLNRVGKGFSYNRQNADLAFLRAGTSLRNQQKDMLSWDTKQKKFYYECIQELEKALLEGQVKYQNGVVNWQPVEQKLRQQSIQWGIGLNAANTVISAAKTVVGFINPLAGMTPTSVGWGNLPNQSHSYGGGFDRLNGDLYSPYYYGVQ